MQDTSGYRWLQRPKPKAAWQDGPVVRSSSSSTSGGRRGRQPLVAPSKSRQQSAMAERNPNNNSAAAQQESDEVRLARAILRRQEQQAAARHSQHGGTRHATNNTSINASAFSRAFADDNNDLSNVSQIPRSTTPAGGRGGVKRAALQRPTFADGTALGGGGGVFMQAEQESFLDDEDLHHPTHYGAKNRFVASNNDDVLGSHDVVGYNVATAPTTTSFVVPIHHGSFEELFTRVETLWDELKLSETIRLMFYRRHVAPVLGLPLKSSSRPRAKRSVPAATTAAGDMAFHRHHLNIHLALLEREKDLILDACTKISEREETMKSLKALAEKYNSWSGSRLVAAGKHQQHHQQHVHQRNYATVDAPIASTSSVYATLDLLLKDVHKLLDLYRLRTVEAVEAVKKWQEFISEHSFVGSDVAHHGAEGGEMEEALLDELEVYQRDDYGSGDVGPDGEDDRIDASALGGFSAEEIARIRAFRKEKQRRERLDVMLRKKELFRWRGHDALTLMLRDLHICVFHKEPLQYLVGVDFDWNPLALPGRKWNVMFCSSNNSNTGKTVDNKNQQQQGGSATAALLMRNMGSNTGSSRGMFAASASHVQSKSVLRNRGQQQAQQKHHVPPRHTTSRAKGGGVQTEDEIMLKTNVSISTAKAELVMTPLYRQEFRHRKSGVQQPSAGGHNATQQNELSEADSELLLRCELAFVFLQEHFASTIAVIQSRAKGVATRNVVTRMLFAAETIQRAFRCHRAKRRTNVLRRRRCLKTLKPFFVGMRIRLALFQKKCQVLHLQRVCRGLVERRQIAQQLSAGRIIMTHLIMPCIRRRRGYQWRMEQRVLLIQRFCRGFAKRDKYGKRYHYVRRKRLLRHLRECIAQCQQDESTQRQALLVEQDAIIAQLYPIHRSTIGVLQLVHQEKGVRVNDIEKNEAKEWRWIQANVQRGFELLLQIAAAENERRRQEQEEHLKDMEKQAQQRAELERLRLEGERQQAEFFNRNVDVLVQQCTTEKQNFFDLEFSPQAIQLASFFLNEVILRQRFHEVEVAAVDVSVVVLPQSEDDERRSIVEKFEATKPAAVAVVATPLPVVPQQVVDEAASVGQLPVVPATAQEEPDHKTPRGQSTNNAQPHGEHSPAEQVAAEFMATRSAEKLNQSCSGAQQQVELSPVAQTQFPMLSAVFGGAQQQQQEVDTKSNHEVQQVEPTAVQQDEEPLPAVNSKTVVEVKKEEQQAKSNASIASTPSAIVPPDSQQQARVEPLPIEPKEDEDQQKSLPAVVESTTATQRPAPSVAVVEEQDEEAAALLAARALPLKQQRSTNNNDDIASAATPPRSASPSAPAAVAPPEDSESLSPRAKERYPMLTAVFSGKHHHPKKNPNLVASKKEETAPEPPVPVVEVSEQPAQPAQLPPPPPQQEPVKTAEQHEPECPPVPGQQQEEEHPPAVAAPSNLVEEVEKQRVAQTAAATKIQALVRGRREQLRFKVLKRGLKRTRVEKVATPPATEQQEVVREDVAVVAAVAPAPAATDPVPLEETPQVPQQVRDVPRDSPQPEHEHEEEEFSMDYSKLPDFVLRSLRVHIVLCQRMGRGLLSRRRMSLFHHHRQGSEAIVQQQGREWVECIEEPFHRFVAGAVFVAAPTLSTSAGAPVAAFKQTAAQYFAELHASFKLVTRMKIARAEKLQKKRLKQLAVCLTLRPALQKCRDEKNHRQLMVEYRQEAIIELTCMADAFHRGIVEEEQRGWMEIDLMRCKSKNTSATIRRLQIVGRRYLIAKECMAERREIVNEYRRSFLEMILEPFHRQRDFQLPHESFMKTLRLSRYERSEDSLLRLEWKRRRILATELIAAALQRHCVQFVSAVRIQNWWFSLTQGQLKRVHDHRRQAGLTVLRTLQRYVAIVKTRKLQRIKQEERQRRTQEEAAAVLTHYVRQFVERLRARKARAVAEAQVEQHTTTTVAGHARAVELRLQMNNRASTTASSNSNSVEERAIIRIQKLFRMAIAKKQTTSLKNERALTQQEERRQHAASVIAGFMKRRLEQKHRRTGKARSHILVIQSTVRLFLARRRIKKEMAEKREQIQREAAARMIQRAFLRLWHRNAQKKRSLRLFNNMPLGASVRSHGSTSLREQQRGDDAMMEHYSPRSSSIMSIQRFVRKALARRRVKAMHASKQRDMAERRQHEAAQAIASAWLRKMDLMRERRENELRDNSNIAAIPGATASAAAAARYRHQQEHHQQSEQQQAELRRRRRSVSDDLYNSQLQRSTAQDGRGLDHHDDVDEGYDSEDADDRADLEDLDEELAGVEAALLEGIDDPQLKIQQQRAQTKRNEILTRMEQRKAARSMRRRVDRRLEEDQSVHLPSSRQEGSRPAPATTQASSPPQQQQEEEVVKPYSYVGPVMRIDLSQLKKHEQANNNSVTGTGSSAVPAGTNISTVHDLSEWIAQAPALQDAAAQPTGDGDQQHRHIDVSLPDSRPPPPPPGHSFDDHQPKPSPRPDQVEIFYGKTLTDGQKAARVFAPTPQQTRTNDVDRTAEDVQGLPPPLGTSTEEHHRAPLEPNPSVVGAAKLDASPPPAASGAPPAVDREMDWGAVLSAPTTTSDADKKSVPVADTSSSKKISVSLGGGGTEAQDAAHRSSYQDASSSNIEYFVASMPSAAKQQQQQQDQQLADQKKDSTVRFALPDEKDEKEEEKERLEQIEREKQAEADAQREESLRLQERLRREKEEEEKRKAEALKASGLVMVGPRVRPSGTNTPRGGTSPTSDDATNMEKQEQQLSAAASSRRSSTATVASSSATSKKPQSVSSAAVMTATKRLPPRADQPSTSIATADSKPSRVPSHLLNDLEKWEADAKVLLHQKWSGNSQQQLASINNSSMMAAEHQQQQAPPPPPVYTYPSPHVENQYGSPVSGNPTGPIGLAKDGEGSQVVGVQHNYLPPGHHKSTAQYAPVDADGVYIAPPVVRREQQMSFVGSSPPPHQHDDVVGDGGVGGDLHDSASQYSHGSSLFHQPVPSHLDYPHSRPTSAATTHHGLHSTTSGSVMSGGGGSAVPNNNRRTSQVSFQNDLESTVGTHQTFHTANTTIGSHGSGSGSGIAVSLHNTSTGTADSSSHPIVGDAFNTSSSLSIAEAEEFHPIVVPDVKIPDGAVHPMYSGGSATGTADPLHTTITKSSSSSSSMVHQHTTFNSSSSSSGGPSNRSEVSFVPSGALHSQSSFSGMPHHSAMSGGRHSSINTSIASNNTSSAAAAGGSKQKRRVSFDFYDTDEFGHELRSNHTALAASVGAPPSVAVVPSSVASSAASAMTAATMGTGKSARSSYSSEVVHHAPPMTSSAVMGVTLAELSPSRQLHQQQQATANDTSPNSIYRQYPPTSLYGGEAPLAEGEPEPFAFLPPGGEVGTGGATAASVAATNSRHVSSLSNNSNNVRSVSALTGTSTVTSAQQPSLSSYQNGLQTFKASLKNLDDRFAQLQQSHASYKEEVRSSPKQHGPSSPLSVPGGSPSQVQQNAVGTTKRRMSKSQQDTQPLRASFAPSSPNLYTPKASPSSAATTSSPKLTTGGGGGGSGVRDSPGGSATKQRQLQRQQQLHLYEAAKAAATSSSPLSQQHRLKPQHHAASPPSAQKVAPHITIEPPSTPRPLNGSLLGLPYQQDGVVGTSPSSSLQQLRGPSSSFGASPHGTSVAASPQRGGLPSPSVHSPSALAASQGVLYATASGSRSGGASTPLRSSSAPSRGGGASPAKPGGSVGNTSVGGLKQPQRKPQSQNHLTPGFRGHAAVTRMLL